jgi:hypothetical protein
MSEKAFGRDRFVWWFPLCAAGCGALSLLPLTVSSSDFSAIFYVLVTIPLVSLTLLIVTYRRRGKQRFVSMSVFTVFVIFTAVLFTNFVDIRDAVRWFVYGRALKAEVLAQPGRPGASLRHMEWEGWGFPGAGNTVVYLVFDPTDALATAARTQARGKFGDLPCVRFSVFGTGKKRGIPCTFIPTLTGNTARIDRVPRRVTSSESPSNSSWGSVP